ncbi:MAG: competence/damage-inducible protein A [Gemmatimonadota bacterium]|nr:competence/damage-inducible protein A [Gemmatimonadota bacterium]
MEGGVAPERPRTAAVLVVGDEILSGEVVDRNAPFLTRRLWELGIRVDRIVVLGDDREALAGEIAAMAEGHDYVLVTGGMGPTHDDVTREAVADALDRRLVRHPGARDMLADDYGERLTPAEARMAELPEGARVLRGRRELAYAFRVETVFAFPGVPILLRDIFEIAAEELLSTPFYKETVWVKGKEGDFSETLAEVDAAHPEVGIGSYPVLLDGRYRCKVVLRSRDEAALRAAVADVEAALELDAPPESA